jgi:hypothetical protein
MKRFAAACMLVVLVLAAAPAHATTVTDPDDVPGRLDVALVQATRTPYGATKIKVTTHDAFRSRLLRPSSEHRFVILFDTDGAEGYEFRGRVVKTSNGLVLNIRGSGSSFEPLRVRRSDYTELHVIVPGDSPPGPSSAYRIKVKTIFNGNVDRAPESGWVRVPAA